MMQSSSLLCSSNSFSAQTSTLPNFHKRFAPPIRPGSARSLHVSSSSQPLSQNYRHALPFLHSTATAEISETSESEEDFVEVGYISGTHGLQGELRVKPDTDFPEMRLSEPGIRWLRQQNLGKNEIQEVELVEGRGYPGQKNWIVRFDGIDTVEQAKLLVGSAILVREEDRPLLEEDEFYTRDLVGMRVLLKETGEPVGTVVNVFDSGGNDLLQVRLDQPIETLEGDLDPKSETEVSGPLVWVPFVKAIVPNVDMEKREMQITPPKGLLELNLRVADKSKKERRQLEWAERKKIQRRMISAKKKLIEMGQEHVFHGLRYGEKSQRSSLADDIVGVNFKLLKHALQNIDMSNKIWNLSEFMNDKSAKKRKILKISKESNTLSGGEKKGDPNFKLQEKGLHLFAKGKVATVLVVSGTKLLQSQNSECSSALQTLLRDDDIFIKLEKRASVPLVLVCPAHEVQSLEMLFQENDHFSFDSEKVWFLEEEKLPIVCSSPEEKNKHKILMKSPWEMLKSPIGSGGVVSLLSSHDVLDKLSEIGVEYLEIRSNNQEYVGGSAIFLGLFNSCEADVGIKICAETDSEEVFDIIFSMKTMKKLTDQLDKIQLRAIRTTNSHGEMVNKEWIDVPPTDLNSYEFRCSIHSFLKACSTGKVCVMEGAEKFGFV